MSQRWIAEQLRTTTLGDTRLRDRGTFMMSRFADRPGASIPQAFDHWSDIKAAYRFLSNDDIEPAEIHRGLCDSTVARVLEQTGMILAIHDTSSMDFSAHPATEGLGPLGGGRGAAGHGFFAHSVLAVGADGVPLGPLHQETWVRDPAAIGKRHKRRELPIEEKESGCWPRGLAAVHAAVPAQVQVLNVMDREADIFELFALPRPANSHLLIRAAHNRCLEGEHKYLWDAVEAASELGRYDLLVRQHPGHKARNVTVAVRACKVTVRPPTHGVHDPDLKPVTLTAVEVRELTPPDDKAPLRWLLLTDLPAADLQAARDLVRCYSQRWLIERYHYTLKSGCKIEDRQLRSADALLRLLALFCVVAWRLLWMTYAAREHGDEPCTLAFSDVEWHILYWRRYGRKPLPEKPPCLRDAVHWLGRLGGFLDRKGDGEPGVKVLWRGMMQLQENVIGYLIATPSAQDVGNA